MKIRDSVITVGDRHLIEDKNRGGNQKFFPEEREFLENCYLKNRGKWSKFETGRIAKTLGVHRKKVTMWKWHRSLKEKEQVRIKNSARSPFKESGTASPKPASTCSRVEP